MDVGSQLAQATREGFALGRGSGVLSSNVMPRYLSTEKSTGM